MFTYKRVKDETSTKYIYDGDLEEDLVSIGIQRSHIRAMKSFFIQKALPLYYNLLERLLLVMVATPAAD